MRVVHDISVSVSVDVNINHHLHRAIGRTHTLSCSSIFCVRNTRHVYHPSCLQCVFHSHSIYTAKAQRRAVFAPTSLFARVHGGWVHPVTHTAFPSQWLPARSMGAAREVAVETTRFASANATATAEVATAAMLVVVLSLEEVCSMALVACVSSVSALFASSLVG